jgi:hypothetical protein
MVLSQGYPTPISAITGATSAMPKAARREIAAPQIVILKEQPRLAANEGLTWRSPRPPPPSCIPDWRSVLRRHPRVIPDWRRLERLRLDWRGVDGPPIPYDVVRLRRSSTPPPGCQLGFKRTYFNHPRDIPDWRAFQGYSFASFAVFWLGASS